MIDDDTLIQLLRITAELAEECRALDSEREESERILTALDTLTEILVKASKARFQ